ncbi:MAG: hypothetical protein ACK4F9_02780 [Brevinematia bacterium]
MKRVLFVLFCFISLLAFSYDRERFYIAEEMFFYGEFIKAYILYNNLDPYKLEYYERDVLNYRLSFMTNITNAVSILSNTSLIQAKELQSFLLSYLGYPSTNIYDIINTRDEVEVYRVLGNIGSVDSNDGSFSILLYFSLSNFKSKLEVLSTNDFDLVKKKFIDAIIFRNMGNYQESEKLINTLLKEYPNSFWAKVLSRNLSTNVNEYNNLENYGLREGYYFVVEGANEVISKQLVLKNYKVKFVEGVLYIGPYFSKDECIDDANRVSRDYRIKVKIVQIRSQ